MESAWFDGIIQIDPEGGTVDAVTLPPAYELVLAHAVLQTRRMNPKTVGNIEALVRSRLATVRMDALRVDMAKQFGSRHIDLVVVCEADDTMAGVITKTGIVQRIAYCAGSACRTAAAEVVSRTVESCAPQDELHDVLSQMKRCGFARLPVVDSRLRPLGVALARDALNALLADEEYEGALLRDTVMGIGYH